MAGLQVVNAVIHQVRRRTVSPIHELSEAVEKPVENASVGPDPTAGPMAKTAQPPIANISIFGSVEVAAERSSE